jgi:glycosyltransferase involved in cell wall biosynthesis
LGNTPVGGLKIVYEYANHLHRKGHSVNVIHPITADKLKSIVSKAKVYRHYIQKKYNKSYKPDSWFSIDPNVNLVLVPYLEEKYIPDADFVIATAWNTAEPTANFSLRKGKKYYFIQNYEIWYAGKTEVLNTFKLPLKKIVISEWLGKLVKSQNENYSYVPNGFDFNAFGMDIDPAARNDNTLMMLYHKLNAKGSRLGLNAIRKAKKVIPELKLILFSAYPLSESLPDWIEFHYKPDQSVLRSLYNKAAVFVSPSFLEGFTTTCRSNDVWCCVSSV